MLLRIVVDDDNHILQVHNPFSEDSDDYLTQREFELLEIDQLLKNRLRERKFPRNTRVAHFLFMATDNSAFHSHFPLFLVSAHNSVGNRSCLCFEIM